MRILACHNFYSQAGGEDKSFADETELLARHGNEVIRFEQHNRDLRTGGKIQVAMRLLWNQEVWHGLESLIEQHRPDVIHCHNTFPKISDVAYRLADKHGIPVVQTLRSYRTICPASSMMRDSQPCHLCLEKKLQWPAVRYACYQGNRLQTAVIAARNYRQRAAGGGIKGVDRFIALTETAKKIFVQAGYPSERIVVKPNFVAPDPGMGAERDDFVLFVGRLTVEKGIHVMLDAWSRTCESVPLTIIGAGPLDEAVKAAASQNANIRWLGEMNHGEVMNYMRRARILLMPSVVQETFGRTLIEAFATGTPVVTSDHGSMAEIVKNGETGLRFTTASADACGKAIMTLLDDMRGWESMSVKARETYMQLYSPELNYERLMEIYRGVITGNE